MGDYAHETPSFSALGANLVFVHLDEPASRDDCSVEHTDSGSFTGTVGSQEAQDLPRFEGETDSRDYGSVAVRFPQVVSC